MNEVDNLLTKEKQLKQELRETQNALIGATTFHLYELESLLNRVVPQMEKCKIVRIEEFHEPDRDYIWYLCIVDLQTGEICAKYPLCCYYLDSRRELESEILVTLECLLQGIEYNDIDSLLRKYVMDNKIKVAGESLLVGIADFEDRPYILDFLRSITHFKLMEFTPDYSIIVQEIKEQYAGKQKVLQPNKPQD